MNKKGTIFLNEQNCYKDLITVSRNELKELNLFVHERIRKTYPGNIQNLVIDYRRKGNSVKIYYAERKLLEDYQTAKAVKKLICCYEPDKEYIFRSSRWSATQLAMAAIYSITLISILAIVGIPVMEVNGMNKEILGIDNRIKTQEDVSSEILEAIKYFESLERKNSILKDSSPPDLYKRLTIIFNELRPDSQILSLTIKEDNFEFRAQGKDPLILVERMKKSENLNNISLQQIQTDPKTGKEIFSMKGDFLNER